MEEIERQYYLLKEINSKNLNKIQKMKKAYKKAVKIYEGLQSQVIQEEIDNLVKIAKRTFPEYIVKPTKFGIKIFSKNGISNDLFAKDENSGLGDYFHGEKIFKILSQELGSPIIKTIWEKGEIVWFTPHGDYNEKTSWVYVTIEYELKKTYLNKKFNFKTAPYSEV